jgi:hypothetical protein
MLEGLPCLHQKRTSKSRSAVTDLPSFGIAAALGIVVVAMPILGAWDGMPIDRQAPPAAAMLD